MWTATIIEDNVDYKAENIKDLAEELHKYITECYGTYSVVDDNGDDIGNCRNIRNWGSYTINTSKSDIHCFIDLRCFNGID